MEFSNASLPANWQRVIYSIQRQGITVIVAHPERYQPVQDNLDIAFEMKALGCRLQLSTKHMEGGRFDETHRTAKPLLKEGLADYMASDAHRPEHYALYTKAWPKPADTNTREAFNSQRGAEERQAPFSCLLHKTKSPGFLQGSKQAKAGK